jgi:hypothetical protein
LTPTGSLPSARWRWWAVITAATPVALVLVVPVAPGRLDPQPLLTSSPFSDRALGGVVLVATRVALAVAAVFQPARRRVQAVVDRRFNRRRHDAARIIQGFGTRLRQQVDLDTLTAELLGVVEDTMQPTHASLWLRPQAPSGTASASLASQRA